MKRCPCSAIMQPPPMDPFDYNYTETDFSLNKLETGKNRIRYGVSFTTAGPSYYPEQNTVYGEFYRPETNGSFPLVILVHGLGDSSTWPCKKIAADLAKNGIASFIIYLVFHSRRMPETIKSRLPYLTPEEWFEGYRTSVIDIRQVLDWAYSQDNIRKDSISVIGISLGGIISAIAMAVDKRVSAGTFIVAGGNYESRTWLKRGRNKYSETECIEARETYLRYLDKAADKGFENVDPDKQSYLTDPVTYAYLLRGRPMSMINALWDERIPKQSSVDLWEALDKPPIKWYPSTHSTLWLWYPEIRKMILDFIKSI